MDPTERLRSGEKAARDGRYADALADYIWFHEHALEHEPALYGVRLSFALGAWRELAYVYPPAKHALLEIRDRRASALLAGSADHGAFDDVASINQYLDQQQATYDLFVELQNRFPDLARACASVAMPALIQSGDFKLARTFFPDPEAAILGWSARLNEQISDLPHKPPAGGTVREAFIRIYSEDVVQLIQVLSAVGEIESANAARELALISVENESVRQEVSQILAAGWRQPNSG